MPKFSLSNLANSVLPVPVGPRNKKLPIGLLSDLSPALFTYTRSRTLSTVSSCPNNLVLMSASMLVNALASSLTCSLSCSTGILVARLIESII